MTEKKGETVEIPREHYDYVQAVLNDKGLAIHEKAYCIHKYDYDLLCRENDGVVPGQMSRENIRLAILERVK